MRAEDKLDHMTIEGLCVGYLSEDVVKRHQMASLIRYQGEKEKSRITADGFAAIVTESAGIRIDVKGDRYFIASSFSYPGSTIGYNRFDPDRLAGHEGWRPRVRKADQTTIQIEGESPQYRLTRTLSLHEGKLRVTDQFTNKTDAPIGVRIRNSLAIPAFPRPGTYFLGGQENQYAPVIRHGGESHGVCRPRAQQSGNCRRGQPPPPAIGPFPTH